MSLIHAAETLNSQIPFGQIGNVISSQKYFKRNLLNKSPIPKYLYATFPSQILQMFLALKLSI